jgi:hypothetical protein
MLRENTEAFNAHAEDKIPITGFSCWALGYLDKNHALIGCLLHPAQNGGVDLRYRTDYGEKCGREFCPEAKVFSGLAIEAKKFWLHLADGLDSFSYSSRGHNPLFRMINWGGHLLSLLASNENHRAFGKESFYKSYPFFSTNLTPRANAYLIKWLVDREGTHILESHTFKSRFEVFSTHISKMLCQATPQNHPPQPTSKGRVVMSLRGSETTEAISLDMENEEIATLPLVARNDQKGIAKQSLRKGGCRGNYEVTFTHQLDLDGDFLNLLRLSARITKTTRQNALALKDQVDRALEEFRQSVERI